MSLKAPSETCSLCHGASRLCVFSQSFPVEHACAHCSCRKGQILYSSYRKRGTYPRMNSSIHLRSWSRWRQHQSGSSPDYGAWCWKHDITVWLSMGLVNPFRCRDVGFSWGWAVEKISKWGKHTHALCSHTHEFLRLYPDVTTQLFVFPHVLYKPRIETKRTSL